MASTTEKRNAGNAMKAALLASIRDPKAGRAGYFAALEAYCRATGVPERDMRRAMKAQGGIR